MARGAVAKLAVIRAAVRTSGAVIMAALVTPMVADMVAGPSGSAEVIAGMVMRMAEAWKWCNWNECS
ncbi:hypothetical protein E2C01_033833 [Portunus trituberculatus]|uniref:Uncharacterized protein n=1 Tax=Portunus trituberculatus TaxID=210409 RepID=A0A5B7F4I1_PORTR|nr:hypothetical protein [Portunus trituberculatus]